MTSTTASNDDVISTLNGLIETCKDGRTDFKEAAEGVERSDLKSLFYEFSQQRSQFAGELQSLVQSLGGDPENTGSVAAAIHRGWINIKSAVTGKDEAAVFNDANAVRIRQRMLTRMRWKKLFRRTSWRRSRRSTSRSRPHTIASKRFVTQLTTNRPTGRNRHQQATDHQTIHISAC
jgi:uncharacterized protein (TIGR02284 family)